MCRREDFKGCSLVRNPGQSPHHDPDTKGGEDDFEKTKQRPAASQELSDLIEKMCMSGSTGPPRKKR